MASDIAGPGLEGPCLCLGESGGWRGGCRRSCLVDLGLHVSAALAAFLPQRAAVLEHDDAGVAQLAGPATSVMVIHSLYFPETEHRLPNA